MVIERVQLKMAAITSAHCVQLAAARKTNKRFFLLIFPF